MFLGGANKQELTDAAQNYIAPLNAFKTWLKLQIE
jgi:hypothetical protein